MFTLLHFIDTFSQRVDGIDVIGYGFVREALQTLIPKMNSVVSVPYQCQALGT